MFKEFKEFALKGNVIDMGVGIIIGAAFGKIVTSLVNDVLMPPLGLVIGKVDFSSLFFDLSRHGYASLAEAKAAGAATINYGLFVNSIIDFTLVSLALFLIIRQVNRMRARNQPLPIVTTKDCKYCYSAIPIPATRCAHCTSEV